MKNKIWLSSPHMGGGEMKYIQQAFDENWIAPLGPNVNALEADLETFLSENVYVAALSSGTAALHMALILLGVERGDEVICQSLTFSASANPIIYMGAYPIFVDSEKETWNLCPNAVEDAIKADIAKGKKPKGIITVSLYGMPYQTDVISEISKRYGIPVIEDSAEALGSSYKNQKCGTFGDLAVLSFNGNKIITTSGGGMLVSDDEEKIKKVRFWSTQSRDAARHYQHSELGFNYRMSNVVAGIGRGQLKVLEQRVDKKKYIFEFYKRELGSLEGVEFMPINDWNEPNYWLSVMTLNGSVRPLDVMEALEKENIESRPIWKPMHLQPFFEEYDYIGSDVSERLFESSVCLPSDTKITDDELTRVCTIIKRLWSH